MDYYRLYNLNFASDIKLAYPSIGQIFPDVQIKLLSVLPEIDAILFDNGFCFGNDKSLQFLSWDDVECQVNKGCEVLIKNPSNSKRLSQIIFSHVIPILLTQRGNIVFHASANKLNSGSVLFLGDNGSGKSTTSAALQQNGYPSLADDCVTCMISESGIFVLPTLSCIRLCTGKHEFVDTSLLPIEYIDDKVTFARNWHSTEPLELIKVVSLHWANNESIQKLSSKEALLTLLKNIWFPWFTQIALKDLHLKLCADIAQKVPVFSYFRPQNTNPSKEAGNFVFNLNS